jgi:hypothetical protein
VAQLALGVAALALLLGLADAQDRTSPASSAFGTLSWSARSVSPKYWRRSEWPRTTPWTSISASIGADTSPVYAPWSASCMVCA